MVEFVDLLRRKWQKAYPHIDLEGLPLGEMWDALAPEGGPPGYGEPDTGDLLEWLKDRGPEDWHRSACTWNWDNGMSAMDWVLDQPECDAGTAITLFAHGEPAWFGKFESLAQLAEQEPHHLPLALFLKSICDRWAAGRYRHYRFLPAASIHVPPDGLPWPVPPTLAEPPVQGEHLDLTGWGEGFPPEAFT
jgi:hypothetical protein